MKILNLSVGSMIMRLHLMSALVVTMGFIGYYWLGMGVLYVAIVLGMLLFLATLMGVKFRYLNPFHHVPKHKYEFRHQRRHHHHHPVHH